MHSHVKTDGRLGLAIANGSILPIEGYGSVKLLFQSEGCEIRLHNGKETHVPMLELGFSSV